jgi:hypothetical protein
VCAYSAHVHVVQGSDPELRANGTQAVHLHLKLWQVVLLVCDEGRPGQLLLSSLRSSCYHDRRHWQSLSTLYRCVFLKTVSSQFSCLIFADGIFFIRSLARICILFELRIFAKSRNKCCLRVCVFSCQYSRARNSLGISRHFSQQPTIGR